MGHKEEQQAAREKKKRAKAERIANQDFKMKDAAWRAKWKIVDIPQDHLEEMLKKDGFMENGYRILFLAAWPEGLHITVCPDE